MNSPPNTSGARLSRSATAESVETLAWPVLASLPRVGAQREPQRATMHSDGSDAAIEYAADRTDDVPELRIAMVVESPEEFEPLAPVVQPATRGTIEFRTFIDQPHLTVRGYDWPTAGGRRVAEEPVSIAAPPNARRRIDAGSRGANTSTAPKASPRAPEAVSQSLATKIFQIHAAAAPHAGIVMTLALTASVGLLCWFTMGRPNAAADYKHVLDGPGGWPTETATTPLPEGAAGVSAAPDQFASEFAWRMTPASEPAAPPTPSAVNVDEQQTASPNDVATLGAPKLELTDPPAPTDATTAPETAASSLVVADVAPAPAAAVEKTAAAQLPEPITPTPHAGPYPTTPYGAFNYFAQPSPTTPVAGAAATATR